MPNYRFSQLYQIVRPGKKPPNLWKTMQKATKHQHGTTKWYSTWQQSNTMCPCTCQANSLFPIVLMPFRFPFIQLTRAWMCINFKVPGRSWIDNKTGITVTIPGRDDFVRLNRDPYQVWPFLSSVWLILHVIKWQLTWLLTYIYKIFFQYSSLLYFFSDFCYDYCFA